MTKMSKFEVSLTRSCTTLFMITNPRILLESEHMLLHWLLTTDIGTQFTCNITVHPVGNYTYYLIYLDGKNVSKAKSQPMAMILTDITWC